MTKPKMIADPDLTKLRALLQSYINAVEKTAPYGSDHPDAGDYHEAEDHKHYIFETALTTFFGPDVFKEYVNKRLI